MVDSSNIKMLVKVAVRQDGKLIYVNLYLFNKFSEETNVQIVYLFWFYY